MIKQVSFETSQPILYLVSTPIGNLADITYRAVETLKTVDLILVEDSRNSKVLLNHYNIDKPMMAYHDHNKEEKHATILKLLNEGKSIALISDAGTPCIADPGYELVKVVVENYFNVVSIPGVSALLSALSVAGLNTSPFTFLGFLPKKESQIKTLIQKYQHDMATLVIYESPNRIKKSIALIAEILSNRNVCIARELTKKFETIIRTKLHEVNLEQLDHRGEYVLLIEGQLTPSVVSIEELLDQVKDLISKNMSQSDAIKQVALDYNYSKNEIYNAYLQTKVKE